MIQILRIFSESQSRLLRKMSNTENTRMSFKSLKIHAVMVSQTGRKAEMGHRKKSAETLRIAVLITQKRRQSGS